VFESYKYFPLDFETISNKSMNMCKVWIV